MMRREPLCRFLVVIIILLLAGSGNLYSKDITIRLFASTKPESAIFVAVSGQYNLHIPGERPIPLRLGEPLLIYRYGERIAVKTGSIPAMAVDSLRIHGTTGASFSLSAIGAGARRRIYYDGLLCRNSHGIFLLLNETTVEKYLPGVVRTEGGPGRHSEFNKTQAVITRTFAYRNIDKHISDGYNMCDDVHCQAYHGITDDAAIIDAVRVTENIVITDRDSVLIMAAFHSNCGGETASASEAWVTDLPYLKKVVDPYCLKSRNAVWSTTITVSSWRSFILRSGYSGDINSPLLLTFTQHSSRKDYFEPVAGLRIPSVAIRNEFAFRSAFFTLSVKGDSLSINGRGYGHGVGLCQEGAMEMATRGNTFNQIISFYYNNVTLLGVKDAKLPPVVN
jgi:stage II sporulation protein D